MSLILNLRAESRKMISKKTIFTALVLLKFTTILLSQSLSDIQNTKVDDLSDDQIEQLLIRAEENGYSPQELYVLAQSRGFPITEIEKLKARVNLLREGKGSTNRNLAVESPLDSLPQVPAKEKVKEKETLPLFGYDYFENGNNALRFEANVVLPAPKDYIIGQKDEITINIYGASVKNYIEAVQSNGALMLNNIGPVYVSGLTLDQASRVIKTKIGTFYPGILGPDPTTTLDISITKIRSVQISIVGEVKRPGNYTINGLSTVLNAIYLAGGPSKNGTLRSVKVLRGNKLVATTDYYSFFTKGIDKNNIRLENQDVILVESYSSRVTITGAVKRPGVFEILEGETFQDLLGYAGGFTEGAFPDRVQIIRNNGDGKVVADIYEDQYSIFELKGGDRITVNPILDKFHNRVVIKGSVNRPGEYALAPEMTLGDLIKKANDLTPDAFKSRAVLLRTTDDLNYTSLSIDLNNALPNQGLNTLLQKEDVINILSKFDLTAEVFVKVSGEVNKAGVYPFAEGMTVNDLIFLAEGFRPSAAAGNIEVSRVPDKQSQENIAEVMTMSVSEELGIVGDDEFMLKPYDHIIVRKNPDYFPPKTVSIIGEIKYEGEYSLLSERDRISSVLKRAGGITDLAYLEGATLIRNTEFFQNNDDESQRQENLIQLLESIDYDYLTEADQAFVDEVKDEIMIFSEGGANQENVATKAKRDRLMEIARRDPFLGDVQFLGKESIAIDLQEILRNNASKEDLILQDGDVISIPKQLTTLRVRGRVLYPNTMRYEENQSLKYFVNKAGGFDTRSNVKKTYVVYVNGDVSRTRSFLFFKSFPKVAPGAEIIVPVKPLKIPLKPGEIIGITSGLATLGLLVTQFIQITNNSN